MNFDNFLSKEKELDDYLFIEYIITNTFFVIISFIFMKMVELLNTSISINSVMEEQNKLNNLINGVLVHNVINNNGNSRIE